MRTIDPSRPRQFGLLDAMILIVALALGLAWWREWDRNGGDQWDWDKHPESQFVEQANSARYWLGVAVLTLVTSTCAWVVLRFRRPRPSCFRMMRQPGAVVCLAASMAFAILQAGEIANQILSQCLGVRNLGNGFGYRWDPEYFSKIRLGGLVGVTVLVAWLILALGHRWRAEPTWLDRSGRLLGIIWIATVPISAIFEVIWSLVWQGRI
jgi:hypothetical protein